MNGLIPLRFSSFQKFPTILILIFFLMGCAVPQATPAATLQPTSPEAAGDILMAQVIFEAVTPDSTPAGQPIFIELLDEVTGLALNPTRYRMEIKGNHLYSIKIPVQVGSLVKYRYGQDSASPQPEYSASGKQVRYRLLDVPGPTSVKDTIIAWQDLPYSGPAGRLIGQVLDAKTNTPVPNMMVTAGGEQTLSAADGSFLIEGIPVGIHNVVAYSLDGIYKPYQQGAEISSKAATPVRLAVIPAQFVNITFVTYPPSDVIRGLPVRIIGNLLALGNTFADLGGGISTVASRAPLMAMLPDGRYSLTLSLPVGLDLRYKFTAGDGFWNGERGQDGSPTIHQLIVPVRDSTIEESMFALQAYGFAPITFTVTVPENTPLEDTISLQFNPYGWTQPIPMWPLGNRQWLYVLYNPLHMVNSIGYRFCRNDQCGVADDAASMGVDFTGKSVTPGKSPQNIAAKIQNWAWLPTAITPTTVEAGEISPRGSTFIAGVEFQPAYRPSWQPYMARAFENIRQIGSNWVVIDPTWSVTRMDPPVFEPVIGQDANWQDMIQMVVWAQDKELNVALFPSIRFDRPFEEWWNAIPNDESWWQSWFNQYRLFVLHNADLAAQVRAGFLVLGDPQIAPSFPGSTLPNGQPSQLPANVAEKWRNLLAEVRARYQGKIAWALPYESGLQSMPEFTDDVDEIYVLWSAKLSDSSSSTTLQRSQEIGKLLDQDVRRLAESSEKPVVLAVSYPAVSQAAQGCAAVNGACQSLDSPRANQDLLAIQPDLAQQALLYNALLLAVNQRPWIDGYISRGFYPPVALQDFTSSIHGKPAADMLWYWFSRMNTAKE